MDKRTAEQLMQNLLAMSGPLNAATHLTAEITDEDERKLIRQGLAETMNHIYLDLMRPIIRQYPEFDPDRDK